MAAAATCLVRRSGGCRILSALEIEQGLQRTRDGRVLEIALARPDDRNCIVPGMLDTLLAWLDEVQHDSSVGAILLRGVGEHFCAGGSMKALSGSAALPRTREERCVRAQSVARIGLLLAEGTKPSLAMLRGSVAGGGLALAAACDMRVGSPTIRMSFGYSRIGLSGDVGATLFLTRLLGPARVRSFALLSPVLDSDAALQAGVIDQLVPDSDLDAEARALAHRFADVAPQAAAAIKQNVAAAFALQPDVALAIEAENFAHCQMHGTHAEAIRAFVEKRPVRFSPTEPVETAPWPKSHQ